MLTPGEIEKASMFFDDMMKRLEHEVFSDVIRRIRINGEITRAADWQLYRLRELGESKQVIRKTIGRLLKADDKEISRLYSGILKKGYERDSSLYRALWISRKPFAENEQLQQYIKAVSAQTAAEMKNLTQSLGFAQRVGGRVQLTSVEDFYRQTLDTAVNGIATGAFDYNTVLKKTVKTMTDSGLRTVDYETGHSDRVDVAARRAVMTGLTQLTAKINEENAKALGTDTFEISWHSGARPSHQVWQGRWYSEKELTTVCGLGSVTGLCGANCYHSYYPVIPGVSVPTYTEDELDEMNRQESIPIEYNGKEYTKYEALQRQRYLERRMRAERQEIRLLQEGDAKEDDLIAARCRYRQTSQTYTDFSKAMELPQQRQRVTIDGLGNIGQGKWKNPSKPVANSGGSGIMETGKGVDFNSGAINGALNPLSAKAQDHADRYYESVRHMTTDTAKISEATGIKKEKIDKIKNHVFIQEHDLVDGRKRFDASYDMAQSWQRLTSGKGIQEKDMVLLKHEYMELRLMEKGLTQDEAHIIASKRYDYAKYCE